MFGVSLWWPHASSSLSWLDFLSGKSNTYNMQLHWLEFRTVACSASYRQSPSSGLEWVRMVACFRQNCMN